VLIGVRENERAAESYSVNTRRTLLLAFSISGFVTGVAGALFQMQQQSISVVLFDPAAGLQVFAMVVVGGLGSIGGAVLGAVYVYGAQYWLPPEWGFLSTGAGMLLVLLLMPGGLGAALGDARDGALRWYARRRGILVPAVGRWLPFHRRAQAARRPAARGPPRVLRRPASPHAHRGDRRGRVGGVRHLHGRRGERLDARARPLGLGYGPRGRHTHTQL